MKHEDVVEEGEMQKRCELVKTEKLDDRHERDDSS